MTISSSRERVVDFSAPFMELGISIMIKKPMKQKPGILSFMSPLHKNVWIAVGAIFIAVALVLFTVHRWSKSGWRTIHKVNYVTNTPANVEEYVNDFTLANSLWFTLGSLLRAGNVTVPRYHLGIWSSVNYLIINSWQVCSSPCIFLLPRKVVLGGITSQLPSERERYRNRAHERRPISSSGDQTHFLTESNQPVENESMNSRHGGWFHSLQLIPYRSKQKWGGGNDSCGLCWIRKRI